MVVPGTLLGVRADKVAVATVETQRLLPAKQYFLIAVRLKYLDAKANQAQLIPEAAVVEVEMKEQLTTQEMVDLVL